MTDLKIELATYREMLASVIEAVPSEAVGFLAGPTFDAATFCRPLAAAGDLGGLRADPRDQYEAERTFSRAGLVPVAIYHSHPDGCGHMSTLDGRYARIRKEAQIIIALQGSSVKEIRAYRMSNGRFVETPIAVVAEPGDFPSVVPFEVEP